MKIVFTLAIIIAFTYLILFCGSSKEVVMEKKFDNGYTVTILADNTWEYNRPIYYRIVYNGKIIVYPYLIELFGNPESVQINIVKNLIYGIDGKRKHVAIFIHRIDDNASWPSSDLFTDELFATLLSLTNNKDLQLSSRVR